MTNASSIRNVAFIGINRSGKTSLVESLLHLTGAISRRGKIADGTMTTDFEPEAIARQISTQVSAARTTYNDVLFNILDCPGFVDFSEEAKLALMGADVAVFVVEPDPHKLIQMDTLLNFTEEIGISRLVFVNKMDKPDVAFAETLSALKDMPGTKTPRPLAPLQYPKNAIAHNVLASALVHKERYDEAIVEAQKAIALDPTDAANVRILADAAMAKGDGTLALQAAQSAIKLDPDNDAHHSRLGRALYMSGNLDAAVVEEMKAVDLNPENNEARLLLARILEKQGKRDEAIAQVKQVLHSNATNDDAKKMLDTLTTTQ